MPLEAPATAQVTGMLALANALDGRREEAQRLAEASRRPPSVPAASPRPRWPAPGRCSSSTADEPEQALDELLAAALLPSAPETAMANVLLGLLARTADRLGHGEHAARLLALAEKPVASRRASGSRFSPARTRRVEPPWATRRTTVWRSRATRLRGTRRSDCSTEGGVRVNGRSPGGRASPRPSSTSPALSHRDCRTRTWLSACSSAWPR